LDSLDASVADAFRADSRLATATVAAGVVSSRAGAAKSHWKRWLLYCDQLRIDPYLQGEEEIEDRIVYLQVFAHRYRTGLIAPSKKPVRSRTVEDAVRAISQEMATVGAPDPRLNSFGNMDFRLQRTWKAWGKQDPPPNRVKPIPVCVLHRVLHLAIASQAAMTMAVADMIAIAFFFLLRPGEYTATSSETTPFRFQDVQLFLGDRPLNLTTAPEGELLAATFATLTFTDQKNGVRGEVIGLGLSGHQHLCPVRAITRRILDIRRHGLPADTPLATTKIRQRLHSVSPSHITVALRGAVGLFDSREIGFLATDISARSLRAAGAMALLCSHVDTDIIRLIGRWRSDEMLRYLHVQAEPLMRDFASRMLHRGDFRLIPNQQVPLR
jgi:hypothetical protein